MKKFLFCCLPSRPGPLRRKPSSILASTKCHPSRRPFDNELGVRYGAQLTWATGGDRIAGLFDRLCRYNFYNIGFRTGLNVFVDEDAENYFSCRCTTWRTGRIARPGAGRPERSVQNNLLQRLLCRSLRRLFRRRGGSGSTFQRAACDPALGVRGPCGLYPGLMCAFTTEGYSTTDPSWRPYTVRQRFSCTFDAGARLIIPIWRFNLFGDFTYHCYLTIISGHGGSAFALLYGAGCGAVVQFLGAGFRNGPSVTRSPPLPDPSVATGAVRLRNKSRFARSSGPRPPVVFRLEVLTKIFETPRQNPCDETAEPLQHLVGGVFVSRSMSFGSTRPCVRVMCFSIGVYSS